MATTTITPTIIAALYAAGVRSGDHHASVKKALADQTGEKPTKEQYQEAKEALAQHEEQIAQGEQASPEELLAKAQEIVKQRAKDSDMPGWENVIRVTEAGVDGAPARVVVRCVDSQTNRAGESVCDEERTINAQDVFQVRRCTPCQKRAQQIYRNELAKRRRAARKQDAPKAAKKAAKRGKKTVRS